jgi:hypothetical protein
MSDTSADTGTPIVRTDQSGRIVGNISTGLEPPTIPDQTPGTTAQIKELGGLQESEKSEHEKYQGDLRREYGELQRIQGQRPKIPTQQKLGPPPDAREYHKHTMAWAGSMAMIGAMFAKGGRMSGQQAMDAFSGAMKGWNEGNLQAYTEAAQKWKDTNYQTLENNRQLLEKYKMVMDDHRLNIDQQKSKLEMLAVEHRDTLGYNAMKRGDMAAMGQLIDNRYKLNESHEAKSKYFADQFDEQENKMKLTAMQWAPYAGPNGENLDLDRQMSNQTRETIKFALRTYPPGAAGATQFKPGSPAELVTRENAERHAKGLPDMTAQEERTFLQKPSRSAPAMAMDAFIRKYQQEHGGQYPPYEEIVKAGAGYAGEVSYQRSAGSTSQRAEFATNEVAVLLPQAVETSHEYLRGKLVPWNKIQNAIKRGESDPTFNDFEAANFALINAYTRAMNPQGVPRVTERLEQHAIGLLSDAISPQAYDTQLRRIWKEVQATKTAVAKTQEGRSPGDINAPVPGLDTPAGAGRGNLPAGAAPTSGTTSSGIPWSVQ